MAVHGAGGGRGGGRSSCSHVCVGVRKQAPKRRHGQTLGKREKKHRGSREWGNVFCMLMLGSDAKCDDMFSVGTDGRHYPKSLELLALGSREERMEIRNLK